MSAHDDLVAQTAEFEALIDDGPQVDAIGVSIPPAPPSALTLLRLGVVLVRWQMRQADELRRIREISEMRNDGDRELQRIREIFEKRQTDELRRIREALERLARFAPDSVESGD